MPFRKHGNRVPETPGNVEQRNGRFEIRNVEAILSLRRAASPALRARMDLEREVEVGMEDLCKSSLAFFSDQQLCYADVLSPSEVRARIEVAVLSFLRMLSSPEPAISLLPLVLVWMSSASSLSFGFWM